MSERVAVELFHLHFLQAFFASASDKRLVAIKGGCNLRFFFGSVRYSEDLDLDVKVIAQKTLEGKIDRLLESPTLVRPLAARGIRIASLSKPKQTATTQRWKIGLTLDGAALHTKVEFSRRDGVDGTSFDAIDRSIATARRMQPFLANHYVHARAVAQKVEALAGRTTPQARDVFDLGLLLARDPGVTIEASARAEIPKAIENADALSYDDYAGQVVAFLEPDQAALHRSKDAWELLRETVVTELKTKGGP